MTEPAVKLRNMTPFDEAQVEIDDLYDEARHWLDGTEVKTQAEADAIAKLLDMARKAKKKADDARKTDAKPFDAGKAAVQARYKPLLSKADHIADCCKAAVTPFMAAQDAMKRGAERIAREEAEAAERAAQDAMRMSNVANVEDRAKAEELAEKAKSAHAVAARLANDKGQAKGGDRALGLRTTYTPELVDLGAATQHYWRANKQAFGVLVCDLAAKDLRAGKREIPGFKIIEERKAV